MIPKIIHLCWLSGDPYPPKIAKCLETWKKHLSDYEVILWDTNRFDLNSSIWVRQAFEKKKYAFAADYIRFYALYHFGGIYLDSDVEVLRSFNDLLDLPYFMGVEKAQTPEAAIIGAEKGCDWIKMCLDYYQGDVGTSDATDPKGPTSGTGVSTPQTERVVRGAGWNQHTSMGETLPDGLGDYTTCARKSTNAQSNGASGWNTGFRICMTLL